MSCSISDCETQTFARGWCQMHYARWWRHGDPTIHRYGATLPERFWSKVDASGDCWAWTGDISLDGYGRFYSWPGLAAAHAHRVAWELLVGPIPPDLIVDHLCRVRHCVNPDHLEPITRSEHPSRTPRALVKASTDKARAVRWGHSQAESDHK